MAKRETSSPLNLDEPAAKSIKTADENNEDVSVRIMVPFSVAGAIIGKKGDALRQLKQETRCNMKMSRNEEGMYPGTQERVMLMKGRVLDVTRAICMIIHKINEKLDPNHPKDPFDHSNVPRGLEMKFVVPNTSAGMVIGKSGARIKEIRDQTNANIQVFPKAGSPEAARSQERVISVAAGAVHELEQACGLIVEKVASDPHHSSGPDSFVPNEGGPSGPGPNMNMNMQGPPPSMYQGPPGGGGGGGPPQDYGPPPLGMYGPGGPGGGGGGYPGRSSSPPMGGPGHRQAVATQAAAGYDMKPMHGNGSMMAPSIKFNPLEGIGNNEVLAFLDNLQTTLRTSGFTEQAVTEVMGAMQVLAKYNIMGLGLGLGVAAMAQMRGGGGAATGMPPSMNDADMMRSAAAAQQIANLYGAQPTMAPAAESMTSLMQAGGWTTNVSQPPPTAQYTSAGAQDTQANAAGGKSNNFAAGVIKQRMTMETNKLELEIPELIVMAVLAPNSKRVNDIKTFTGVHLDTTKKSPTDPSVSIVSMQGDNDGLRAARLMIERAINEEHARRQQQAQRQQQSNY